MPIDWLIAKDVDLQLLGITSSLSSSYNGDQPVECTFNEGPASTTPPTFDKEPCLQENAANSCYLGETNEALGLQKKVTSYCDINRDEKDTAEQPQPPMVGYVYSSGEEANEPMRKDPNVIQDSREKQQTAKTESEVEQKN